GNNSKTRSPLMLFGAALVTWMSRKRVVSAGWTVAVTGPLLLTTEKVTGLPAASVVVTGTNSVLPAGTLAVTWLIGSITGAVSRRRSSNASTAGRERRVCGRRPGRAPGKG